LKEILILRKKAQTLFLAGKRGETKGLRPFKAANNETYFSHFIVKIELFYWKRRWQNGRP